MVSKSQTKDQHIAVFGGSGSGKTVLISSFYGAAQEQAFLKESLFDVIADDTGQGRRLRQNYLKMANEAAVPGATRFAATPYAFTLKIRDSPAASPGESKPKKPRFKALRLVWHDYPGEWFEEEPSSEEESRRRVETFRKLLRSDVAFVLVDGQKLLDYAGQEEKYLKSMLGDLRDGVHRLKEDLLDEGRPLVEFPRIWILALSKADLHPDLDVHGFQDLVIEKAAADVEAFSVLLKGMVETPDALSVGEDFLLLSSARFEPGRIEVTSRVGLDLILPVSFILPVERLVQWGERFSVPRKVLDKFADNAEGIAAILAGNPMLRTLLRRVPVVGPIVADAVLTGLGAAVKISGPKIAELNEHARKNHDYLTAVITKFRLDLDRGVRDGWLVKSRR